MHDAPSEDLIRMVELPMAELRVTEATDGNVGTLVGYAAVFNADTIIDSWEGTFVERLIPGAFRTTLKQSGDRVKVLFNHGFDPSIGDKPLGKPQTLDEHPKGLWHETPMDDTSYNRDLVASIRSGALDGQSFRFSVKRDTWYDPGHKAYADHSSKLDPKGTMPIREVQEVKLFELGPVTFPAYEATTLGIRARQAYVLWQSTRGEVPGGALPWSPLVNASAGSTSTTASLTITPEPADSGSSSTSRDDAADSGTQSPSIARPMKVVAQAIHRAKELSTR